jgi:hypothetical protein
MGCRSMKPVKPVGNRCGRAGVLAIAGSPGDPRMQEAMRLMEAFLAMEVGPARAALIALAERLITQDWVRRAQRR